MKLNEYSFKDKVVGNSTPSKDNINPALLQDIQTAEKNSGVKVDITTAISGHGTDKPSRHPSGNAVDIAIINGKAVSSSNRMDVDKFVAELVKMGYVKNKEVGNPKAVLTFGFPNHDDHVHVSNTTNTPTEIEDTKIGQSETGFETSLTSPSGYKFKDPLLMNILKGFDYLTGLNENNKNLINKYEYLVENKTYSSFGKNVISVGKSLILSAKDNPKIKSPVDGKTQSFTYNPSCQNQIVIKFQHNNENFYLEYCGIDRLSIGKNSNVGAGTKLGETSTDVNVNLYNSNYQKTYFDEILKTKGEDFKKDRKDGISKGYKDPLLIGLTQLPGKLLKKIWASPTDPDQPESFASKWNPTKKVNENIEKIKRLLK